jgi:protein gp37
MLTDLTRLPELLRGRHRPALGAHDVFHLRGERRMLSDAYWRTPLKWNRRAQQTGTPTRVFCASMADVFENHPQVTDARARLWQLIEQTPWLRWQLLTKRPENIAAMAPWGDAWPDHVWIGTSVENQRYAEERIPALLKINAPIRFLSCEPLVEQIDLRPYLADVTTAPGIHWVIAGGESGAKARPMNPAWARVLRDQCDAAGTSYFFKHAAWTARRTTPYRLSVLPGRQRPKSDSPAVFTP